jgi:hypothetical protein
VHGEIDQGIGHPTLSIAIIVLAHLPGERLERSPYSGATLVVELSVE